MNIEIYGTGERMRVLSSLAREIDAPHLLLLPIPSTRDGAHVSGCDILLSDTLCGVGRGSFVFGYSLPCEYRDRVRELSGEVYDLSENESFLEENAKITAVGTLLYVMSTEKRQPSDIKFGIVGYGRIGSELLRLLLFFGAGVKVYTKREFVRLELIGCGVEASGGVYDGTMPTGEVDILINTAPCDLSYAFPEGKIPDGMRVLELASGRNFAGVDGVELLPSLPERYFPVSAARAYASAIKACLEDKR